MDQYLQSDPSTSIQNYSTDQEDQEYFNTNSSNSKSASSSPQPSLINTEHKLIRDEYPTPSTDNSNDTDESSSSLNYGSNISKLNCDNATNNFNYEINNAAFTPQFLNLNESRLTKLNENNSGSFTNLVNYSYPIKTYFNNVDSLQSNFTPDLFQSFNSVQNFDPYFNQINNFLQPRQKDENNSFDAENSILKNRVKYENEEELQRQNISNDNGEMKQDQQQFPSQSVPSFLMKPPDSECIAAAAASASINRSKRRTRIKFDKHQLDILEAAFQRTHYPDVNVVDRLAGLLKLGTERISVWFQNRRARYKKSRNNFDKSSENISQGIDCLDDILKDNKCDIDSNDSGPKSKALNTSKHSNKPVQIKADYDAKPDTVDNNNNNSGENIQKHDEYDQSSKEIINRNMENEAVKKPKPIFNPLTLPSNANNSNNSYKNQSEIYYPQLNTINPYGQLLLPVVQESGENSSYSSRSSTPASQSAISRSSTPSVTKQGSVNSSQSSVGSNSQCSHVNYSNFQPLPPLALQTHFQAQNFLNHHFNQAGYTQNLYKQHLPTYNNCFSNIFQPYIDYNDGQQFSQQPAQHQQQHQQLNNNNNNNNNNNIPYIEPFKE